MSNPMKILSAKQISKSFKSKANTLTQVLSGLDMYIKKGELATLMGPSGVGKSTLLQILGTLDNADSGEISLHLNEKVYNYSKLSEKELSNLRNQYIGFIFQFHHLLPEFDALENIMMPALIAGKSIKEIKPRALELIDIVGVTDRQKHKPQELSGGEQQRVAIARSLINNPSIVFADEPTGNLDQKNTSAILDLLNNLRQEFNLTFLIATHSKEVAQISERTYYMSHGIIEEIIENHS
jgi:lipoprotein-releasing system ATP-binding protein